MGGSAIWEFITHSDEFVPEAMQTTQGVSYERCDPEDLFRFTGMNRSRQHPEIHFMINLFFLRVNCGLQLLRTLFTCLSGVFFVYRNQRFTPEYYFHFWETSKSR